MKRQNFLHGALVLTAGTVLVKVIGALFKIPLKYAIGEYGMGLFNVAYNIYGPVFSLATAGFPIAVSRLVSESRSLGRWNDVRQVKRAAMPLFLTFGGAGMLLITLTAPFYCARVIDTPGALAPVLALAPAVLFACAGSVYRGYYEGLRDMTPTALSQVIEALIKLILGLALSRWVVSACTAEYGAKGTVFSMLPASPDEARFLILSFAAAAAILGVTAGSAGALLYLFLRYRIQGDGVSLRLYRTSPAALGRRETAKRLLAVTVPIAIGSIATNVAGLIDSTFLQSRLSHILQTAPERLLGCFPGGIPRMYLENPESIPTFLYGCYSLAMTVYLLVPSLTQAFGVSALPAITEAWSSNDRKELQNSMGSVCRITAMFCFPAGLGIAALADPIVRVLYGSDSSAPIISGVLALLGASSLAAAMSTPFSSMLQAVGRADLPVKLLFCAMAVKIGANWFLCGVPEWNISGAAVGTFLCYLFLAAAQFMALKRVTGCKLSGKKLFFKPFLCAGVCALGARTAYAALENALPGVSLRLGISVVFGAVLYGFELIFWGGVEKNDLKMLPKGQKIAKTLEKWGWI